MIRGVESRVVVEAGLKALPIHVFTHPQTATKQNARYTQACDMIRGVDSRVVVEAELKVALGLRMTKGHRTWRK